MKKTKDRHSYITPPLDLLRLTGQESSEGAGSVAQWLFNRTAPPLHLHDQVGSADALRTFHTISRACRLSSGDEQLGLGFPLIYLPEGEILPLFILPTSLEPSLTEYNDWALKHKPEQDIFIYPPAANLLRESGADIFLREAQKEICRKENLNDRTLKKLLLLLATETHWPMEEDDLHPLPEKEPEKPLPSACIIRSPMLGFFPRSQSPIPENEQEKAPPTPINNLLNHRIGLRTLPPLQSSALETALRSPRAYIACEDFRAGMNTITELLTLLLANGRTTIVVSDKTGPLQHLQKLLHDRQLDGLNFLWQQKKEDTKTALKLLEAFAKSAPALSKSADRDFQDMQAELLHHSQLLNQINRRHELLRATRKDGLNFEEWVGRFLLHQARAGREILGSVSSLDGLEFTPRESEQLSRELQRAERLFQKIRRPKHPLRDLHPDFFTSMAQPEAQKAIEERLDAFAERLHETHHRLIHLQARYRSELLQYLEDNYLQIEAAIRKVQDQIANGAQKYGRPFRFNGLSMLKLKARLSKQASETLHARKALLEEYSKLRQQLAKTPDLQTKLPAPTPALLPARIAEHLQNIPETLTLWRNNKRQEMEDHCRRLSAKTAWEIAPTAKEISTLEQAFDELIEDINAGKLYHTPFENRVLTLPARQQLLEQILEKLENTRYHLNEFKALYPWQHFLLKLPAKSRKVILALARINPMNWHAAFLSWYYDRLLHKHYDPLMRQEPGPEQFEKTLRQIQKLQQKMPDFIQTLWLKKSTSLSKYNPHKSANKEQRTSTEQQVEDAATQLSCRFPVLLMNSFTATELFPHLAKACNYLLLIDAGKLPNTWEKAAHQAGIPCSRWAWRSAEKTTQADARIPQTPDTELAELRLITAGSPCEADGSNLAEADLLIQMLNKLQPAEGKTWPRVAMAAFNQAQRNLLNDYLRRLQMQKKQDEKQLLPELMRRGLAVFSPEEIIGSQYDLLLVSLCLDDDKMPAKTQQKISLQINRLRQMANKAVYLIHSLNDQHPLLKKINKKPPHKQSTPPLPCPALIEQLKQKILKKEPDTEIKLRHNERELALEIHNPKTAAPAGLLLIDGLMAPTPYAAALWELQIRRFLETQNTQVKSISSAEQWMNA